MALITYRCPECGTEQSMLPALEVGHRCPSKGRKWVAWEEK